jgi:hypothetical protein
LRVRANVSEVGNLMRNHSGKRARGFKEVSIQTFGSGGRLAEIESSRIVPIRGRSCAPFPLTLTLSLGEREQRARRGGSPAAVECSPGSGGFTLSQGRGPG